METRQRLVIVLAGLRAPVSQLEVFAPDGRFVARLDLGYEEFLLAIEYDGALHWEQRREDDRRRDALRALGWTVLVFSAVDVYRRPAAIVAQVRAALLRAGAVLD
jgi:very-short-patch-repair endonuclease